MNNRNDEPAFPSPIGEYEGGRTRCGVTGMTLRDYFAAKVLQGLLACGEAHDEHTSMVTAGAAYKMADAMLAARERCEVTE